MIELTEELRPAVEAGGPGEIYLRGETTDEYNLPSENRTTVETPGTKPQVGLPAAFVTLPDGFHILNQWR